MSFGSSFFYLPSLEVLFGLDRSVYGLASDLLKAEIIEEIYRLSIDLTSSKKITI